MLNQPKGVWFKMSDIGNGLDPNLGSLAVPEAIRRLFRRLASAELLEGSGYRFQVSKGTRQTLRRIAKRGKEGDHLLLLLTTPDETDDEVLSGLRVLLTSKPREKAVPKIRCVANQADCMGPYAPADSVVCDACLGYHDSNPSARKRGNDHAAER
jgi:hypothetical protein